MERLSPITFRRNRGGRVSIDGTSSRTGRAAQVALEFSLMVMVAFLFLGVILIVFLVHLEQAQDRAVEFALKETALLVQQELLLAAGLEDGYRRNFTLPFDVAGQPYAIAEDGEVLTLALSDGRSWSARHPLVTGAFTHGTNIIRKQDGVIHVNP